MYKAIEVALSEVGYKEKVNSKNLYDKNANAGSNNYTKFADILDKLGDFYNGKKQGYEWCEVYADSCFVVAYGEDIALKMLYQPRRSAGAGCEQSVGYYKSNGAFYKSPKVGDQIYFTYGSGTADHTGLVYAVDDTYVYTVEGNNGNCVAKHMYNRKSNYSYGYGRPNYALAGDNGGDNQPKPAPEPKPQPIDNGGQCEVFMDELSRGSSGSQVETLQSILVTKLHISCGNYGKNHDGVDGDFGFATEQALKKAQKLFSLDQDGICGKLTWKAILGAK